MTEDEFRVTPEGQEEREALSRIRSGQKDRGRPRRLSGKTGLFEHLELAWHVMTLIERDGFKVERALKRVAKDYHTSYQNVRKHYYREGRVALEGEESTADRKDYSKVLRFALERAKGDNQGESEGDSSIRYEIARMKQFLARYETARGDGFSGFNRDEVEQIHSNAEQATSHLARMESLLDAPSKTRLRRLVRLLNPRLRFVKKAARWAPISPEEPSTGKRRTRIDRSRLRRGGPNPAGV